MTDAARPERDPNADLRPSDRLVLRVLREAGGELRLKPLREEAGLPAATAHDSVTRLSDRELVESRPVPENPQLRVVSLSES